MADVTLKDARGPHISQAEVADLITDMAAKANAADVPTNTDLTLALAEYTTTSALTAALADKANASSVYTKAETESYVTTALDGVGGGWEIGAVREWDAPRLPSDGKWAYKDGAAISRTTHSDCFDVYCPPFTGDTTSGSAVISNIDDMSGMQVGQIIEGTGIPAGAVISSLDTGADTITLDQIATATATTVALRFITYGAGDGSTTFNLPDDRGRVKAGRDNMGGTAAGRLSNTNIGGTIANPDGSKLGETGGSDRLAVAAAIVSADTSGEGAYVTLQGQTPPTTGNPNIGLKAVSNMPNTRVTNMIIKILP